MEFTKKDFECSPKDQRSIMRVVRAVLEYVRNQETNLLTGWINNDLNNEDSFSGVINNCIIMADTQEHAHILMGCYMMMHSPYCLNFDFTGNTNTNTNTDNDIIPLNTIIRIISHYTGPINMCKYGGCDSDFTMFPEYSRRSYSCKELLDRFDHYGINYR